MLDLLGTVESTFGHVNGLTATLFLGALIIALALWTTVRPSRFPPGPRGFPIVGSMLDMTDNPEVIFKKWSKKYGDIIGFKVGERWMVALNGQEVIKEAMVKRGVEFAGRPEFYSMGIFSEGFKDIVFTTYSDTWKLHRKLAFSSLRHFATGKPLQDLISSACPKIRQELAITEDKPVNPKILLSLLMYNILSQMCFGKSCGLRDQGMLEFSKSMDEANEGFGLGLLADFFSWAKYLPTGSTKWFQDVTNRLLGSIRKQAKDVQQNYDSENIDNIYSLLLKAQEDARKEGENVESMTDTRVFQTIVDIFSAGTTTTIETLYWSFALLVEHPHIQARVHEEIDRVIGRDRIPVIDDRGTLPFTEATLYEVMRFSSILPIALPHSTTEDVEFHGYVIPKDTVIMINTHSMHYDPKEWEEPESFTPEHFLDESGTVRQHPSSFMPFGAGRRVCLGEAVAKADLFLIFTWFLQNYSFSKAPGKEEESLIKLIPQTASGRFLLPYEIMINERN